MPVGEDQRPEVGGCAAHRGQFAGDVLVEAGHPGVDDRHLAGLLDEVRVDHAVVADPVDSWRNLHDGILPPAAEWASMPLTSAEDPPARGVVAARGRPAHAHSAAARTIEP